MSPSARCCYYYYSAAFILLPTTFASSSSSELAFLSSRVSTRRTSTSFNKKSIVNTIKMLTSNTHPPSYKRAKLSHLPPSTKTIGTHSGTFQADEALGVWLLRQLPLYRNSPVIRSRDNAVLDTCDIVIDVGGVYDHASLKYDHHQRGYDERFSPKVSSDGSIIERCTKLSASGLVYRHYGKEVICEYYPELKKDTTATASGNSTDKSTISELDWVYNKMYGSFMEAIDAIDTGVEPIPPTSSSKGNGEEEEILQLQYFDSTGLSSRVGRTNPRWNEIDESTGESPDPDARFEIASKMCGTDFLSVLTKIVESDLPARSIVESAVQKRFDVDASGEIICLPTGGLPWKSQVYELEQEYGLTTPIKYVLYTDQAGMWRIQCVSVEGKAFENRLSLPSEWRGVRDEDLSSVAGIKGCTFCHASGFIGGNKSYDGVLEMARVALKNK